MMRTNGTYTFQSLNFERKNQFSENINNESEHGLFRLFVDELKEMYWSEIIMIKILAKIIKNTSDLNLIIFLKLNLEITIYQTTRLEDIFIVLDEKNTTKSCEPIKEMLGEINSYIKHYEKGKFKDEIMMLNIQKIAQFKIDSYDSFYEYAKSIGEYEVAGFLLESLNEKIALDSRLAEMSDSTINLNLPEYF